jgi:phosphoribosylformylglycinamidine synthase
VKVVVTVRPKAGILDPQGEALRRSLAGLGHPVADVRAGKVFDLELDVAGADEAQRVAEVLAQHVLSNPLIEEFEVEVGAPA